MEATEAAKTAGWVSPSDYLTSVSGGRRGHGQRLLRTARGLCGSRTATYALTAGDVSPEHAEVIVAVIDRLPVDAMLRDEAEQVLLDQAASLNASELRKAGDHLLEVLDPDGTARAEETALDRLERSAHLGRFLTIADDGLGGVRVKGRGTVEDAAIIKTALHALAAPLPGTDPDCGEAGRDTARPRRPHLGRPRRACLRASEVEGLLPDQHGAKPRLTVTGTLDQLREGLRVRDPGHRRRPSKSPPSGDSRATPSHPRRARLPRRGARRRPDATPGHRRDLEGTRAPRPALSVPGLRPDAARLRRPPPQHWADGGHRHSTISSSFAGHTTRCCTHPWESPAQSARPQAGVPSATGSAPSRRMDPGSRTRC